jgi:hypothetical protein
MSDLNQVGDQDNWRCWLCDQPVDPDASVNSDLGPSVDSYDATRVKKGKPYVERLAHRMCNTMTGKNKPVAPWSKDIFVVDPTPLVEVVERLDRKGGREVVARCPDLNDARQASDWLLDRLSRLAPGVNFTTELNPGGGQYMLVLRVN